MTLNTSFQKCIGVSPEEYLEAYRNHKSIFQKTVESEDFNYQLTFVPSEVRYIHLWKNNIVDSETLGNYLEEHKNYVEFNLLIDVDGFNDAFLQYQSDSSTYDERLQYYAFEMQNDIKLNADGKVIECAEYVFERNFGMDNKAHIKLGFAVPKYKQLKVEIDNRYSDKSATVEYTRKEMRCLPQLKKLN